MAGSKKSGTAIRWRLLLATAPCFIAMMASSMPASSETPTFRPAKEWTVGAIPTSGGAPARSGSVKVPCIIANEYDNGYIIRFSGGGGQMMAMAIDFRQNAFTQGRQYNANVSLDDSYSKQVKATAFTPSTLIVNLRSLEGFYDRLQNSRVMQVNIESNSLVFSLQKLPAAFDGFEACYNGKPTPGASHVIAAKRPSADAVRRGVAVPDAQKFAKNPLPKSMNDIVKSASQESSQTQPPAVGQPMPLAVMPQVTAQNNAQQSRRNDAIAPLPGRVSRADTAEYKNVGRPAGIASSAPQPLPVAGNGSWNARAGEDMKAVLSRWAQTAGYDLDWQATGDTRLAQDFSIDGSFEQAVSQLMAENGAASGVSGYIQDTDAAPKRIAGGGGVGQNAAFVARKGESLKSILQKWSGQEGASVVWNTSSDMKVKSPVSVNGSYETAVQTLLDQYANDSKRPVGRLNNDPSSGQKTLVIDMDKAV